MGATDDGGYYATVDSNRFNNTMLGVYAYPDVQECIPFLVVGMMHEDRVDDGSWDTEMMVRVDGGEIYYIDALGST